MVVNPDGWRVIALVALVYSGVVSVALLLAVISLAGYVDQAAKNGGRGDRSD